MSDPIETPEELSGPGVRLRRWQMSDRPQLETVREDPVIRRWSTLPADPDAWLTVQAARPNRISLAVTAPPHDTALGQVALGNVDRAAGRGELSYWLVPDGRGRGLATAAARVLCRWAFEVVGLHTVVLDVERGNDPSRRVARALGAGRVGPPHAVADLTGVPRELDWFELRSAPG